MSRPSLVNCLQTEQDDTLVTSFHCLVSGQPFLVTILSIYTYCSRRLGNRVFQLDISSLADDDWVPIGNDTTLSGSSADMLLRNFGAPEPWYLGAYWWCKMLAGIPSSLMLNGSFVGVILISIRSPADARTMSAGGSPYCLVLRWNRRGVDRWSPRYLGPLPTMVRLFENLVRIQIIIANNDEFTGRTLEPLSLSPGVLRCRWCLGAWRVVVPVGAADPSGWSFRLE